MSPEGGSPQQSFAITGGDPAGTQLFRERMEAWFSVCMTIAPAGEPFRARVQAYRGRRLRFAQLCLTPHLATRPPSQAKGGRLLLSIQQEGCTIVHQDGRESRIGPGDMFILDTARAYSMEAGHVLTRAVYLPPDSLRGLVPELERLTAVRLPETDPRGAVLRAMVKEMFVLGASMDDATAEATADALPPLLATAVAHDGDMTVLPSRLRAHHKQRILRFVLQNLRDPALDADLIAASVDLSTRYLYAVLRDEGMPLMKWIWRLRLERCRADLGTPSLASCSIAEIALAWGFSDVAHFSRAFRQRYGCSPTEHRQAQLACLQSTGHPG